MHARAHVRHELEDAAAARERQRREEQAQQQAAAARAQYAQELALLEKQDVSLAASEAVLRYATERELLLPFLCEAARGRVQQGLPPSSGGFGPSARASPSA